MIETTSCTRCLLPPETTDLSLDDAGVCQFCRYFDVHGGALLDYPRIRGLFEQRFDAVRGKYDYDALVGISGGKDGAYVLHRLVNDYGLNVLAFTFDNGFLAPDVEDNVRRLSDSLGVDHCFHRPNLELLYALYRVAAERFSVPCVACALSGYFLGVKVCIERRIPFFVHGRSPHQMFRVLDARAHERDPFLYLGQTNFKPYDAADIKTRYGWIHMAMRDMLAGFFPDKDFRDAVFNEFFFDSAALGDFVPEMLAYFLAEHYVEAQMREDLRVDLGYVAPPTHADCEIHETAGYLFIQSHGVNVAILETATMLRHDDMGREEAAAEIEQVRRSRDVRPDCFGKYCQRIGVEEDEIMRRLNEAVSPFAAE